MIETHYLAHKYMKEPTFQFAVHNIINNALCIFQPGLGTGIFTGDGDLFIEPARDFRGIDQTITIMWKSALWKVVIP